MELKDAVRKRRSIRSYKADPVPQKVLTEIIDLSLRAPSGMNNQPWEITVVANKSLKELCRMNVEALRAGKIPFSDFGPPKPSEGIYKERQRNLGLALYGLLGIARDDKEKRMEWTMKGFRAFDAPALIILCSDESFDDRVASSDTGGLIQTICLIALEYGLGTCINGQGVIFPDFVRKVAAIPDSKKIHICISIGYPDWDHPANKLVSEREPVENVVNWVGFD